MVDGVFPTLVVAGLFLLVAAVIVGTVVMRPARTSPAAQRTVDAAAVASRGPSRSSTGRRSTQTARP